MIALLLLLLVAVEVLVAVAILVSTVFGLKVVVGKIVVVVFHLVFKGFLTRPLVGRVVEGSLVAVVGLGRCVSLLLLIWSSVISVVGMVLPVLKCVWLCRKETWVGALVWVPCSSGVSSSIVVLVTSILLGRSFHVLKVLV